MMWNGKRGEITIDEHYAAAELPIDSKQDLNNFTVNIFLQPAAFPNGVTTSSAPYLF